MHDERDDRTRPTDEPQAQRTNAGNRSASAGEEHYRAMFEHMASGFALYEVRDNGSAFVFKDYNPAAEAMNGVRREEILGRRLDEVFPETRGSEMARALTRVWQTGETERLAPVRFDNGALKGWRKYVIYKLPGGDVAAIIDDVTEHERTAREARRKAAFLQATLDAVNDGIWDYSIVDDSFQCSDRLAEMLDCSTEQLACHGPLCRDIMHPDDVPVFDNALARCRDGECGRLSMELRLRSGDGGWKWFYARGSVVDRDADGRPARIIGAHTDLTEHKRAEERLRESLELFSSIFENAYTPMLLISPGNGRIVEANEKACELYGYSRRVLKSMSILDINALPHEMIQAEMERARQAKRTFFRFKHRLATGELRDVEVHTGPVHIHGRDLLYSIIHDVTERRMQEEALYKSEAMLSAIFRAAPVGMGTVKDRVLIKVNDVLCEMIGRDLDELHNASARILYPSDEEFLRVGREKHPLVERHGLGTVETRFQHADGRIVHVLLSSAWLDPADHAAGLVFTALDITDRLLAQDRALAARRTLHHLVDTMPSAIFVLDDEGRVRLGNLAASRMTGRKVTDLKGHRLDRLVPGIKDIRPLIRHTVEAGAPTTHKELPREVDGALRFFDMLVYPQDDMPLGRVVVRLDDVTDRVHMAESMVQNEKMVSVGGLAAGMAHELNNPLAGVLQGTQNIRRRLDPALHANTDAATAAGVDLHAMRTYLERRKVFSFLDGITEAGGRAAGIISDMLDFSRAGGTRSQALSLHDCLEGSIRLARNGFEFDGHYDFRNITIHRNYADDLPDIHGHESELRQVFLNLLTNATQAMRDKRYEGEVPTIAITTRREKHHAVVEVQDNGPGIPEVQRARIFDPFFTTKSPGQGTGLGLSVSYFIVTRTHGGTITVTSHPGEYTRFTVKLPLHGAASEG